MQLGQTQPPSEGPGRKGSLSMARDRVENIIGESERTEISGLDELPGPEADPATPSLGAAAVLFPQRPIQRTEAEPHFCRRIP